jgi:ribosomal protein S18 acetylase RimI-like enzyme
VHLSEVVVDPILQRRGVARAMIDTVLLDARRDGFAYVEAQWRRRNVQANSFWPRYGLTPTYARLARTLD